MDPENIELDVLPEGGGFEVENPENENTEAQIIPEEPVEEKPDEGEDVDEAQSDFDEEQGKLFSRENLNQLRPWLALSFVGLLLIIVAVVLLCTGMGGPPFVKLQPLRIPSYQGSIKIKSIGGKSLKFMNDLKYIGSMESVELRHMVEPKLVDFYEAAGLDVDEVVVLAFKYGGAGKTMNMSKPEGRMGGDMDSDNGICVRHWVYTRTNSTMTPMEIADRLKITANSFPDVEVELDSIMLYSLSNMTYLQAFTVLSQHGFFKYGIRELDLKLLSKLGVVKRPKNLGVQSGEDDGVCPPLTTSLHTTLSPTACRDSSSTYLGMVCTFECTGDRTIEGSAVRVCLSTGQWSGLPTKCKSKCPAIHLATQGSLLPSSCSNAPASEGQMCFVQCPNDLQLYSATSVAPGYTVNSLFRECQSNGWTGDVGYCKARCSGLHAPPHSTLSSTDCTSNPQGGDICAVECNVGYVLKGGGTTQQLTCGLNGQWDHEVLHCKKTCQAIVVGSNQMVEPSTCAYHPYEGETCKLSCSDGYTVSGVSNRLCMAGGTWNSNQATCVPACSALLNIAHGAITTIQGSCFADNPPEGTKCSLICDSGYTPSADFTTCDSNGDWTVANIMCLRACPLLSSPISGGWSLSSCSLNGHHSPSADCTLTCNAPYTTVGASVLTCDSNTGAWNTEPGHCAITCNALMAPMNGGVSSTCTSASLVGTSCTYTCDAGYKLTGSKTVECLSTGLWSAASPGCGAETQYLIKQTASSGVVTCLHSSMGNMVIKKYGADCTKNDEGNRWILVGATNIASVSTRDCLITCASDDARLETAPCNVANVTQHFASGFQFKVQSNDGRYVSSGHHTSDLPQLTAAEDRENPDSNWKLEKMDGSETTLYGARNSDGCKPYQLSSADIASTCSASPQAASFACTVSCVGGYTLSNPAQSNIQCVSGSWDQGSSLMCLPTVQPATTCHAYDTSLLSGVTLSPATCTAARSNVGDICTATCTDSSSMLYVDGPTLSCLSDGSWSSYKPTICKTYCSAISVDTNTKLLSSASECIGGHAASGTVCPFGCPPGYALDGKNMLTCLDSGLWDNPAPLCKRTCPVVSGQSLTVSGCQVDPESGLYLSGSVCMLSCGSGYALTTSSSSISCNNDGMWQAHGDIGCARACPPFPSGVISSPSACSSAPSTPGTICTLSCATGMLVVGSAVVSSVDRVCGMDSFWDGPFAYCTNSCPPLTTDDEGKSGYYEPSSCSSGAQPPGTRCQLMCQGQNKVIGGGSWNVCANNGTWLPDMSHTTIGTCYPTCQPIKKPLGGSVSPQTCMDGNVELGTECIISCPSNMDRVGPGVRKCFGVGEVGADDKGWSGDQDSRCVARCPPLTVEQLTFVFPPDCTYKSKLENEHCVFECQKGLALIGAGTLTCTDKGEWNNAMPHCQQACPEVEMTNGKIYCSSETSQPLPELGYVFEIGTKCVFVCDEGYTTLTQNEITCIESGLWSPMPYCREVTNTFSILQKIETNSKCLVSKTKNMEYLLDYVHSSEECVTAGNDAMWLWHGKDNIQHAQTGLCLAAQIDRIESFIELQECNVNEPLQHWDCGVNHPFRVELKNTDLAIDSTYAGLGPMLTSWTYENSYWITFNSELETTASICSFKASGTCPAINLPNLTAYPAVCMSGEVKIWQKCNLACADGTYLSGPSSTECSPTGVWKNVEKVRCVKKCPALVADGGKMFSPSLCTSQAMDDLSTCKMTCSSGNQLMNGESEMSMICEDGKWSGTGVECIPHCVTTPPAPMHGSVVCNQGTCKVSCDPGYKLSAGSDTIMCAAGSYNQTASCSPEIQFMIQSSNTGDACLALDNNGQDGVLPTHKVTCDKTNKWHYWKWNNNMLQHVQTGKCLNASSSGDWMSVTAEPCIMDDEQLFTCASLNPYNVVFINAPTYRLDLGSAIGNSPIVSTNGNHVASNNFKGVDQNNKMGTLCSFKNPGSCPGLLVGPGATVTSECALDSPIGAICTVTCQAGYAIQPAMSTLTCTAAGVWDHAVPACVAALSSEGTCSPFSLGVGISVTPSDCGATVPLHRGTSCMFECEPGYFMMGTDLTYCTGVSNLWTATMPQCKSYCLGLPSISGSSLSPMSCGALQVLDGTVCTRQCEMGCVTAAGSTTSTRTCAAGKWTGNDDACMMGCTLQNGTTDSSLVTSGSRLYVTSATCVTDVQPVGSSCMLSCPANYVLVDGTATLKCTSGGHWNGPIAKCIPSYKCPQVSSIGSASVVYEPMLQGAVVVGTAVTLTCATGYMVLGENTRLCLEDGTWSGSGPASSTPVCQQLCAPILPKFLSVFSSDTCTNGYSNHGDSCTMSCGDNVPLSNGDWSITITCQNGVWSDSLPSCIADPLTPLNVFETRSDFMMISSSSIIGCFSVAPDNTVVWLAMESCDAQNPLHRWAWSGSSIKNMKSNLCLQPIGPANDQRLGVGTCVSGEQQVFMCGNPDSPNLRFSLFPGFPTPMRMYLEFDQATYLPSYVAMVTVPANHMHLNREYFETIIVAANANMDSPQTTDKPVCSYSCGGLVTDEISSGYIASPGYLGNGSYLPNTECEWIFAGYNKKITLTLLELDLESNLDADYVQIYEGSSGNILYSEHLRTYAGQDPSQYDIITSSIKGNVFVKFKSNGNLQNGGFVMSYKFEVVTTPPNCGISSYIWPTVEPNIIRDVQTLPSKVDEGKWPWVVSIRETAERSGHAYPRCTGALVDANTVISAAHCAKFALTALSRDCGVSVGLNRISQFHMNDDLTNGSGVFVSRLFIHPDYDDETRTHNIAVWKLSKPIMFGAIQPACLPINGYNVHSTMSECYVAGWTRIDTGSAEHNMMEYPMKMDTSAWCESDLGLAANSGYVCAKHIRLNKSGFRGTDDSEPLLCKNRGQWHLVGVASHTHIGSRSTRRLYTSVHLNNQWLNDVITMTSSTSYKSQNLEKLSSKAIDRTMIDAMAMKKWFETQ